MAFHVVAGRETETNRRLVAAFRRLGVDSSFLRAQELEKRVRSGDVALGRVDVLPTLDGVEACLWNLRKVERHGVRVLNGVGALLAAHDKLATALKLGRAGVPHPATVHLDSVKMPALEPPVVLKPRFGSWGRDVVVCETSREIETALASLTGKRWFRRHGVLVQELVPPAGHDLRILVARGRVIGAVERRAAPGEWRTNISLGGTRHPTIPSRAACLTAVAAATAIGGDLVGVDLLPTREGYVALELNGAVDFNEEYSFQGRYVFADAAEALVGEHAMLVA